VLGSDQERALRRAANAAVQQTVTELNRAGDEQARRLAAAIEKAFKKPMPEAPLAGHATLLQALRAGIAERLAVLDADAGHSFADTLGVPTSELAEELADHLVGEITLRGSRGGPLTALSEQLNQDMTHLLGQRPEVQGQRPEVQGQRPEVQGQRLEAKIDRLAPAPAAAASQAVRLLPRPTFLYGREELLTGLDARLTAANAAGPQVVALYGLGGAGKTSLALEYTYRDLDGLEVAWQLAAEDAMTLAAGFGDLAAQLCAADLLASGDPVARVHALLAARPGDWLLIFDNGPGPAALQHVLPPKGRGRVIITSLNPDWPGGALEVPVLDPDVAAEFLISRTGDLNRQAAAELARELGGLPLEQAAAYIQATATTLAWYLSMFRSRQAAPLARGQAVGHPAHVTATFGLALSRLEDEAPTVAGLLRLLACLASEPVPLALLLADARVAGELAPGVVATVGPLLRSPVGSGQSSVK